VLPNGIAAASLASLPFPKQFLAAEAALALERARTQDPPGSRWTENRRADVMNAGADPLLVWDMLQGMGSGLMRQPAAGIAMPPPSMLHTTPAAGASFARRGPTYEHLIGLDRVGYGDEHFDLFLKADDID
jgi:hypothetical protein